MSKVTVAKSAGFCFGVDRAVKMVYGELEKNTNVATLGPIIHNQDVVNDMQAKGARIVNSVEELRPDETVVIRSHGVGRDIYRQIEAKGNKMLDATCPFVSRIHKIVAEKTAEGYFILIAGDRDHPEVQGIVGHCDENCLVFKDNFELKAFFEKNLKRHFGGSRRPDRGFFLMKRSGYTHSAGPLFLPVLWGSGFFLFGIIIRENN